MAVRKLSTKVCTSCVLYCKFIILLQFKHRLIWVLMQHWHWQIDTFHPSSAWNQTCLHWLLNSLRLNSLRQLDFCWFVRILILLLPSTNNSPFFGLQQALQAARACCQLLKYIVELSFKLDYIKRSKWRIMQISHTLSNLTLIIH